MTDVQVQINFLKAKIVTIQFFGLDVSKTIADRRLVPYEYEKKKCFCQLRW